MRSNQSNARTLCLTGVMILAGVAVVLLMAAPSAAAFPNEPAPAAPQVDASIWLRPPTGTIEVDTEISVTVALSDVVGMYGLHLQLSYPADRLQVVDASPAQTGIQSTPGDCPAPSDPEGFVILNTANNSTGVLTYAVTQLKPTLPVSGHCDVLHIQFMPVDGPTAQLTFDEVTLADIDTNTIPVTLVHQTLTIESEKLTFLPMVTKPGNP